MPASPTSRGRGLLTISLCIPLGLNADAVCNSAESADIPRNESGGLLPNLPLLLAVSLVKISPRLKSVLNQLRNLVLVSGVNRGIRTRAPETDKDWYSVQMNDLEKLMDACPNDSWKTLLALCRLAGLRRGEAVSLMCSAIDRNGRRRPPQARSGESLSQT
jgi:hypothetical protein